MCDTKSRVCVVRLSVERGLFQRGSGRNQDQETAFLVITELCDFP